MRIRTILPGQPMATIAARHLLAEHGTDLASAILLMPTRRACNLMRLALIEALGGKTALLPRILPLGDLEAELPGLLPATVLSALAAIPPAMPEWKRISLLVQQIQVFGQGNIAMDHALRLAQDLAKLHDQCIRENVALTMEVLRTMVTEREMEKHWELSLKFLAIVAETWPLIEEEEGAITAAARQMRLQQLLTEQWETAPITTPIIAIGSTASQPATARLLRAIARMEQGEIILPGLDPSFPSERWDCIAAGHPLFHLKNFLDSLELAPADLTAINDREGEPNIWLTALECADQVPGWRSISRPRNYQHIRLIPCAHGEEETRTIALLVREALETKGKRIALVTPDEGLLERAAAHLARYGITPNRIKHGSLSATETGSLWLALMRFIDDPARTLPLLALLRHPRILPALDGWLNEAEPKLRGLNKHQPGQLPSLPPALRTRPEYALAANLVRDLATLNRKRQPASQWISTLNDALKPFRLKAGEGAEPVTDATAALAETDILGPLDRDGFAALLNEALSAPWRGGIYDAHPDIFFLTPVEARLQRFDRVILANMQDSIWPGLSGGSAWLNLAQQKELGLPAPEEHASLMAHDLLLLGSMPEVFLTYPERDKGSPTTRSRFIERLAALLAVHGIKEESIHATQYPHWAEQLHKTEYKPSEAPRPAPITARRPTSMAVSKLDRLTSDPYSLYAYYVLGLRELDPIDREPEASELGTLVHGAMKQLTDHWNLHQRPADSTELGAIRDDALAPFKANPEAALFWRHRLGRALGFVNHAETKRREARPTVTPEQPIESTMQFDEATLTLHGRIDRLEEGPTGLAIGDYKTGQAPTKTDIQLGRAPQLLAYALILEAAGKNVETLDYWELPGGKRPGTIMESEANHDLITELHRLIGDFLNPETPLLARPIPDKAERYINPYDGVSRYDEWAG